jgi:hypothetical protein
VNEVLQHLVQVSAWHLGHIGQMLGRLSATLPARQANDGAQGVLGGFGQHGLFSGNQQAIKILHLDI